MQRLRNLRLSARLALAFGALALGLVVVGATALAAMSTLSAEADHLAANGVRSTQALAALEQHSESAGHLLAQHLYVYDGDLEQEDAVANQIAAARAAGERANADLTRLLAGTAAEQELRDLHPARAAWKAAMDAAVKASRGETLAGTDDRDGSRRIYLRRFVPAWQAAASRAAALTPRSAASPTSSPARPTPAPRRAGAPS
jgi:hypothetical protein